MSKQAATPTNPKDCPFFGQELPSGWRCPPCPLAKACFEAYTNPAAFVPDWTPPANTGAAHTTTFVDCQDDHIEQLSRMAQPDTGKKDKEEKQTSAYNSQLSSAHFNSLDLL